LQKLSACNPTRLNSWEFSYADCQHHQSSMKDFKNRWALITGASTGIGEEFARRLGALGMNLVIAARRIDRLEAIADDVRNAHGVTVHAIQCDFLAEGQPDRLVQQVAELGITVDLLINNAGVGVMSRCESTDVDEVQRMLDLNIGVLTRMTYAYLKPMLARGSGTIVNLASRASFQPVGYMPAYGASKAYVLSFTEALWAEVRGRGVHVMAVCPGFIKTEFLDVAHMPPRFAKMSLTPKDVVDATLKGLRRRWPYVVVGLSSNVMTFLPRLFPRGGVAIFSEQFMRPRG
jgi:short-subunit dehydrogenase